MDHPDTDSKSDAVSAGSTSSRSARVGIRQVASHAGVSTATVSRVLNQPDSVATDLRARVLSSIEALQYVPHSAARALSRLRTNTLGIIIPTVRNSIFAAQVDALQKRASERGYNLVIAVSEFDPDMEVEQARALVSNGVEGLMLVGSHHRPQLYEFLQARGIAYVNTTTYDPKQPHPCIGFDNVAAAGRITRFLLDLGHTRFGIVSGHLAENDRSTQRLIGIRKVLASEGIDLDDAAVFECRYTIREARHAFRHMMQMQPRPTAVIAINDVLAVGVLFEAHHMGIAVPAELSVVGFDDLELAQETDPPLTTMRAEWEEMATLAGDYLINRLNGKPVSSLTQVDVELIVRSSTGPAPRHAA